MDTHRGAIFIAISLSLIITISIFFVQRSHGEDTTKYWYSSGGSTDWNALGNWWDDAAHTVASASLPTMGTPVVVLAPTHPIIDLDGAFALPYTIDATASGISFTSESGRSYYRPITGNVDFYNKAVSDGTITGTATFHDYTYVNNTSGIINGTAIFDYARGGVMTLRGGMHWTGTFNGPILGSDGIAVTSWVFNESSINGNTIVGDATFNDTTYNSGNVIGTAVFNGDLSDNGNGEGTVIGIKIRRYSTPIRTRRNFVRDGPWTVLADGAEVSLVDAVVNETTTFSERNGGYFVSEPPETVITTFPIGANPTIAFELVDNDNDSDDQGITFLCSIDDISGVDWEPCTSPVTYSSIPPGEHTFYVEAIDTIQGYTENIAMATWVVPTPPTSSCVEDSLQRSQNSATLYGVISSTGGDMVTTRGFEWGPTDSYGNTTVETGDFPPGPFSAEITGLTCGTTYHYRSYATNAGGTGRSTVDSVFTTSGCTPAPVRRGGGGGVITPVPSPIPSLVPATGASSSCNVFSTTKPATPIPEKSGIQTPTLFSGSLHFGDVSDDVKRLQQFFNTHGFILGERGNGSPNNETTFFGSRTVAALVRFQETYLKEILLPIGLTKGTGFFGQATINFVNKMLLQKQ